MRKEFNDQLQDFHIEIEKLKDQKDYFNAIQILNEVMEISDQKDLILIERGDLKAELSDLYGAISDYTSAFEINPKNTDALIKIGMKLKEYQKYESALEYFKHAIKINTNCDKAYVEIGCIYNILCKRDPNYVSKGEASNNFSKAIEINPRNSEAHFELGMSIILNDYVKNIEGLRLLSKAGELGLSKAYEEIKKHHLTFHQEIFNIPSSILNSNSKEL